MISIHSLGEIKINKKVFGFYLFKYTNFCLLFIFFSIGNLRDWNGWRRIFIFNFHCFFFFEIQLKYVNEWWLLVRIRLRDFHFNCFYFNEIYFYGYFFQIEGNWRFKVSFKLLIKLPQTIFWVTLEISNRTTSNLMLETKYLATTNY